MNGKQTIELTDKEYDCPICLSILVEPVTMPCNHSLCMPCYTQTVEKANLACPICRLRISVWARKATKSKTLVDTKKWNFIQKNFPDKVSQRLEGNAATDSESEEEDLEIYLRRLKELSEPGEIRQEYEAALEKLRLQREEEARKEEEASRALIEALQAEEFSEQESTIAALEAIEKIDRQKALEIDQEQQSQNVMPKVKPEKPAGNKSWKIGNNKSSKQNKAFTPTVTLNKFFAAVPHQALSPLPLSNLDFFSQSNHIEKTCMTPGVSDFCWSRANENFEGGHMSRSLEKEQRLESKDTSPGPSGLSMVKKIHLVESQRSNVDFNSKSYQPVVRCENNIRMSQGKFDKASTECSIKSFIHKKESNPPSDAILENVIGGRLVSEENSATDYFDNNKTTFSRLISSPSVPADGGLEQNAKLLVGSEAQIADSNISNDSSDSSDTVLYLPNNSSDAETISGDLVTETSDDKRLQVDKASSPTISADGKLKDETVVGDCLNALPDNQKYSFVDLCAHGEISCTGPQETRSPLDCKQKNKQLKAKGKTKSSFPQKEKNSLGKSLLRMNTLDSFVKTVKRDAGNFEQPCGKRQKCFQANNDSGLDQEEADRLLALQLQEMYQYMEKKHLTVERFEGSAGEYSLRKKHKS